MSLSELHAVFKSSFMWVFEFIFILIACSFVITACGGNQEEVPVDKQVTETVASESTKVTKTVTPENTQVTTNNIATEIQANREKWKAHGISKYEIEIQKICYCIPEVVRMMIFKVADYNVETARYADTGESVDPKHYGEFNTIDSMFSFVERALKKNPADITITYDEKYGYITELNIDFKVNIADDEISVIASNMRPK